MKNLFISLGNHLTDNSAIYLFILMFFCMCAGSCAIASGLNKSFPNFHSMNLHQLFTHSN